MDLSCHVLNTTVPLPLRANSAMRDSLKSAHGKKKKRKGGVPRLQLSMEQLKRMYSNSTDRSILSESIFAMDDHTAFVL